MIDINIIITKINNKKIKNKTKEGNKKSPILISSGSNLYNANLPIIKFSINIYGLIDSGVRVSLLSNILLTELKKTDIKITYVKLKFILGIMQRFPSKKMHKNNFKIAGIYVMGTFVLQGKIIRMFLFI